MTLNTNLNSPLSIISWNANGLSKHKHEFQLFLETKNIDIALISETHFTPTSHSKIFGYQVYYTCHPDGTAHAGTAIYIKNNLSHHQLAPHSEPYLQATTIQVNIVNSTPIAVSAIYCPPGPKISSVEFQTFFSTLGQKFIVGGDFNSKHPYWGNRSANTRGRALKSVLESMNFSVISPPSPTYWPSHCNRLPDILDIFVSKIPNHIHSTISNLNDLSSDHTPIYLEVGAWATKQIKPSLTSGRVNWPKFKKLVTDNINLKPSLKTTSEIDSAILSLTSTVQNSAAAASSNHPPPRNNTNFPAHIMLLLADKRRARTQWHRSKYPSDKAKFNYLKNKLNKAILKLKNDSYQNYILNLSTKDSSLWKATKKLIHHKPPSPPLRMPNNSWASSDSDKASIFAEHLANAFKPHNITPNKIHTQNITRFLESPLPMALPAKHTSPGEIQYIIRKLPTKKAPGHDLISNLVVKHLPEKSIILLALIFNSMFRLFYFPTAWKHSNIILIPKPDKPPDVPSSYRPISLLPTFAKIFEKILL